MLGKGNFSLEHPGPLWYGREADAGPIETGMVVDAFPGHRKPEQVIAPRKVNGNGRSVAFPGVFQRFSQYRNKSDVRNSGNGLRRLVAFERHFSPGNSRK